MLEFYDSKTRKKLVVEHEPYEKAYCIAIYYPNNKYPIWITSGFNRIRFWKTLNGVLKYLAKNYKSLHPNPLEVLKQRKDNV